MYRDRDEALKRLQEQLLEEEEDFAEEVDEETLDNLLEETDSPQDNVVYQNFSNGYGEQLRNYASGYRAYNSDVTDTDLEDYSEQVRQPKKINGLDVLAAVVALLIAAVVALLLWYWKWGGVL